MSRPLDRFFLPKEAKPAKAARRKSGKGKRG